MTQSNAVIDYAAEFIDGFITSLKGFPAIFHLDDQIERDDTPPTEPSPPPQQKMTVLQRRARKAQVAGGVVKKNSRDHSVEKDMPRRKSARLEFAKCVGYNLLPVAVLFFFRFLCSNRENSLFQSLVFIIIRSFCFLAFIIFKILSLLWFGDIAKGALNYRTIIFGKKSKATSSSSEISVSENISDLLYGTLLEIIVLVIAMIIYEVPFPYLPKAMGFLVMSQLNALYSFEYLWLTKSIRTLSRVSLIENHWPYYSGFGAILTLATTYYDDFIINGFIFAGLFPFFIVSSYMANPPTADKPKRQGLPIFDVPRVITEKIFRILVRSR